jgi:hypothetical protein
MSTQQWRFALEGTYYIVEDDTTRSILYANPILEAHANKLPIHPPDPKRSRRTLGDSSTSRRTKRSKGQGPNNNRLADRLEVAICFGVHGGFDPYTKAETVRWGCIDLNAALILADRELLHKVVWELSVVNFRFEFLDLDRTILKAVYTYPDESLAAHREYIICNIWNNGSICPAWMDDPSPDPFSHGTWIEQVDAVKQMLSVISYWPGRR